MQHIEYKEDYKNNHYNYYFIFQTLKVSFRAKESWGPRSPKEAASWREFKAEAKVRQKSMRTSIFKHVLYILVGGYRWRA